ncbi:hypothetical protein VTO42DRAFT_8220 [Malbranchea cinnamomea]
MDFQPAPTDMSVIITVANQKTESSFAMERRVTPTWTVSQLKSKLETMTGIPPGSQRLCLKTPGQEQQWMEGDDRTVGEWRLAKGCEIEIHDTRPASARIDFSDLSSVEKYTLPTSAYESMSNTVLSWKKNQKLGRFDPNALSPEEIVRKQAVKDEQLIQEKGIEVSKRAIILPSSPPHIRRGTIRFVGPVPTIPLTTSKTPVTLGPGDPVPLWVGIELDEPTGKNDGSVGGQRYFTCPDKRGVFVKPEKVEVGDFPPLDLFDENMEEI